MANTNTMEVDTRELARCFLSLQLENVRLREELANEKKLSNMWHHEWKLLKKKYEPEFFEQDKEGVQE